MVTLLIICTVSAGSIAFLSYFGFALWRDAHQKQKNRVLVLKLRESIARKRHQPRVLYMHKLEPGDQRQSKRARKI